MIENPNDSVLNKIEVYFSLSHKKRLKVGRLRLLQFFMVSGTLFLSSLHLPPALHL